MRKIAIALIAFSTLGCIAQDQPLTMHVISLHQAAEHEKSFHTALGQRFIETRIADRNYTLSEVSLWASCTLEVGADYPVVKATSSEVVIMCPESKHIHKPWKAHYPVETISEVTQ